MPVTGEHQIHNPEFIEDKEWDSIRKYVYNWVYDLVGDEHRYLIQFR